MNEHEYRAIIESKRKPEPVSKLTFELPKQAEWREHTCTRCKQTRKFMTDPGELCWGCRESDERSAQLRARRRANCGIGARHAKFQAWDDLKGPRDYMARVQMVRKFVTERDSILALIGTRGVGKTQMACVAVAAAIDGGKSARITTAIDLLADLKRRYDEPESGGEREWVREWAAYGLLVVDEIGDLVSGDHSRSLLTKMLDERYRSLRPTVLIGNVAAKDFATAVGSSVADRCNEGGGIVVCDTWPSFRK